MTSVIETARLILRQFTLHDVAALAAIYADPEGMQSKGGPRTYAAAQRTVEEALQDYATVGYGFWATQHKVDGILIGLCGLLNQTVDGKGEVEIAYTLARAYWGQGLATEAAQAIQAYGFAHLPVSRLISLITPTNVASQRVALKNGMVYEKTVEWRPGQHHQIYAVYGPPNTTIDRG